MRPSTVNLMPIPLPATKRRFVPFLGFLNSRVYLRSIKKRWFLGVFHLNIWSSDPKEINALLALWFTLLHCLIFFFPRISSAFLIRRKLVRDQSTVSFFFSQIKATFLDGWFFKAGIFMLVMWDCGIFMLIYDLARLYNQNLVIIQDLCPPLVSLSYRREGRRRVHL